MWFCESADDIYSFIAIACVFQSQRELLIVTPLSIGALKGSALILRGIVLDHYVE